MPTKEVGLNEGEYLAIVGRIQQAMCIEPFRPDAADVIVLIGTCQMLNQEIGRLRAAHAQQVEGRIKDVADCDELRAENERLHAIAAAAQRRQEELEVENKRLRAAHEAHISDKWCPICDPDLASDTNYSD